MFLLISELELFTTTAVAAINLMKSFLYINSSNSSSSSSSSNITVK